MKAELARTDILTGADSALGANLYEVRGVFS